MPAQLLQNRRDIRQAECELAAAGLDVRVARTNFYPKLFITGAVGYEAFNPKYLYLTPESLIYSVAGDLVGPLINKTAIKADYMNANARQLQAVYNYQRTVLNAFTEVINYVVQGAELQHEHRDQEAAVGSRSRPRSISPAIFFRMPASNTWTCYSPSATWRTREWSSSKPNSSNCLPS